MVSDRFSYFDPFSPYGNDRNDRILARWHAADQLENDKKMKCITCGRIPARKMKPDYGSEEIPGSASVYGGVLDVRTVYFCYPTPEDRSCYDHFLEHLHDEDESHE